VTPVQHCSAVEDVSADECSSGITSQTTATDVADDVTQTKCTTTEDRLVHTPLKMGLGTFFKFARDITVNLFTSLPCYLSQSWAHIPIQNQMHLQRNALCHGFAIFLPVMLTRLQVHRTADVRRGSGSS